MMKRKPFFIVSLLLSISLFASACSSGGNSSSPAPTSAPQASGEPSKAPEAAKDAQVLNLSVSADLPTMNSLGLTDVNSSIALNNVMEGLYRLDKDSKPVPGIAEKVDISPDAKMYTFHLHDAKWSNGAPVTAQDFEYAWKRAVNPDTISPNSYFFNDIKNAIDVQAKKKGIDELGVKALDAKTFQVELANPAPYFLGLASIYVFFPLNKEYIEKLGKDYALEAKNMIYNGPFVLDAWKHEEGWTYKKNPDYWDAKSVKLDQVNVKIVKEAGTAANLYETNQLDYIEVSSDSVEKYKTSPEYSVSLKPEVFFLRMNQKNPLMANVNIRKAIDMAWDKQGVAEKILNNGSVPAYYLVPKGFAFGPDGKDFRDKYAGFNKDGVSKAQELWKKGLSELGMTTIKLEFLSYDSEATKPITQYIKNQLEKNLPGLTLTINQQPGKQKLDLESKQQYDIDYSGWSPDYQDSMTFIDLYLSNGSNNWSSYNNPEFDKLVSEARTGGSDMKARWEKLQEAERILVEQDAAISPMYQSGLSKMTKPYLKDLVIHPFGVFQSYKWAYIEGKKK